MRPKPKAAGEFAIQRASTGNAELDSLLGGGFPRGSLILVSGNPGTGKTIFSAGVLYQGARREKENGVYVSFSEDRKAFFENMRTVGLDMEALEEEGRFKFLEMFATTREGMGKVAGELLETIRATGARRLVVDSYSAMAQAIGTDYEGRQVLHTVLGKIVRNLGCTTLVICEQPTGEDRIGDGSEEFVADGVLNLKHTIPRELEIRKMRGTKLWTRAVTYTIDNGFRVLTTELRSPAQIKRWEPIPDTNGLVSTGSRDLDAVLGGGLPRGAYVVLESSSEVMIRELRLFTRSLCLNAVNQMRGVLVLPTGGVSAKEIKAAWTPYTTAELFDNFVRIFEQEQPARTGSPSPPPYVVPMTENQGVEDEAQLEESSRRLHAAYRELKARSGNQPVIRNIGYDSMETMYARYPEKLLNEVGFAIATTRAARDITLGLAKPSLGILDKIAGIVDWHLRLTKKNGLLMFQGVKPYTSLYAVDCDVSRGYPETKLSILT